MKDLIYITGQGRAGGSLIARILDNNQKFASYPFEYRYHKNNIFPDFRNEDKFIHFLKDIGQYKLFELFFSNRTGKKKPINLSNEFDKKSFYENLEKTNINSMDFVKTINFVSKCFFESHKTNFYNWDKVKYIAWHASKPIQEDIDYLLKKSEGKLKIIHIIRSPFDQISSSLKKNRNHYKKIFFDTARKFFTPSIADNFYLKYYNKKSITLEPEYASYFWLHSVYHGSYYSQKYPKNYFLVRYEDIVSDIDQFSIFLQDKLNLEEPLISSVPSYIGKDWKSNSSFDLNKNINKNSIGIFEKYLSEEEIQLINDITSPALCEMGYVDKKPFFSNKKNLEISLSKYIKCMSSLQYSLRKYKK